MCINQINNHLAQLWNDQCEHRLANLHHYAPLPFTEPTPESVVFVGMNPSFSVPEIIRRLTLENRIDIRPEQFFGWPHPDNFDEDLADRLEARARNDHPFFAPHRELSGRLNLGWEHYDLFACRETNQNKVRALVLENGRNIELNQFGADQFNLFQQVLSLARPRAVVVVNALASRIYHARRMLNFDNLVGFYTDNTSPEHSFPVFLSGMLTGQRALDRFGKERLFWQITNALQQPPQADAIQDIPGN